MNVVRIFCWPHQAKQKDVATAEMNFNEKQTPSAAA